MKHRSVMVQEVLDGFRRNNAGWIIDATFGSGGHSLAILNTYPNVKILGIDRDPAIFAKANSPEIDKFINEGRLLLQNGKFSSLKTLCAQIPRIDGILFDLGYSTAQVFDPNYGLSYYRDHKLDMRLGTTDLSRPTAAHLLNWLGESQLDKIFREYGDLKSSRLIARSIVEARMRASFERSIQLFELVQQVSSKDVAKVFQCLRVAVNDEIDELRRGFRQASELLARDALMQGNRLDFAQLNT